MATAASFAELCTKYDAVSAWPKYGGLVGAGDDASDTVANNVADAQKRRKIR